MEDCIFCKIVKGEIPCTKIFENDKVLAFLDIMPVSPGHTLVIPKEHKETLLDLPEETIAELGKVLKKVSKAVMATMEADGFNIGMNNYKAAGQLVPHAHFHIIPRTVEDGLKAWPQGKYQDKQMDEVKDRITSALQ